MGTWGAGNLANDTAMDEIGIRSNKLAEQIWIRLGQQTSWEADEWAHAALFVDLETLFALNDAKLFSLHAFRTWDGLDARIERWMKGWEAYYPQLGPSDAFLVERRTVIQQTFARLKTLVAKGQS